MSVAHSPEVSRLRGLPPLAGPAVSLLLVIGTGCVSARMPVTPSSSAGVTEESGSASSRNVERLLRDELDRWEGTPHLLGGTTAAGMDCSAFVQRVFADAFEVNLPRSTEEQVRVGRRVDRAELRTGDLVFFRPPTEARHVGVYLGSDQFAHVSSTQGVTVSSLDLAYWRAAYWTSRRVLEDPEPRTASEPLPMPVRRSSSSRRVGW